MTDLTMPPSAHAFTRSSSRAMTRRLAASVLAPSIAGACIALLVACGGGSGEGAKEPVGTTPGPDPSHNGGTVDPSSTSDAGPTSTTTMTSATGATSRARSSGRRTPRRWR